MEKKFKLGFIVGRFQLVHKGHEQLIDFGLELCEKFVVLVGSANESRTEENPFTFEERKQMLEMIYGNRIIIIPIVNIGIGYVPEWGNYLFNTIKLHIGEFPDFVIGGSELDRSNWLSNEKKMTITQLIVSRSIINISATKIRQCIKNYCPDSHDMTIDTYLGIRKLADKLNDNYYKKDNNNLTILYKYYSILRDIKEEK